VYDDGETPEGLPYIVMEYLDGECLEDRIVRDGSVPLAESVRIATHVGRALGRAHSRGIVHRDLKPANVFLTRNEDDEMGWIAKVLDFGIAKLEDNREKSTTKTGTVLGTPLFMSPEQVRGASTVDARADLYSVGMVVYNMLTGRFAFEGQSFGDLLVSICTDPLPELSAAAPWAPQALNLWFKKACARDPADRFQSADELVDELYSAANLSYDGRMSFADESSAVINLPGVPFPGVHPHGMGSARGNIPAPTVTDAIAATQDAGQFTPAVGGSSSGTASVLTIPGVPQSKKWVWPVVGVAALGGLAAAGLVAWSLLAGSAEAPTAEVGAPAPAAATEQAPKAAAQPTEEPAEKADEPDEGEAEAAGAEAAKAEAAEAEEAAAPAEVEPKPVAQTAPKPRPVAKPRPIKHKPKKSETKKSLTGEVDIGF
jgi:serine/threonine-protein kinase